MDTYGDTKYSETAKNLFNQLRAKEITLGEFLRECAYWAIKARFDELRPYPFPTAPNSQAFMEYEALPPMRKVKVDSAFFHQNPEILGYYNQVTFIRHRNKANFEWLKELLSYLPEEDEIRQRQIENRIAEFKAFFDDNPLMVERIKNIFEARDAAPDDNFPIRIGFIEDNLIEDRSRD